MAIRYAVTTGVWSNTATWDGGTLPTSADDIFSNNFTVTVDQDISASSLRNTSNVSPAITQGGFFNVTGNTGTRAITLTGTTGTGGSSPAGLFTFTSIIANSTLRISSTSGATVNISTPLGAPQVNVGSNILITGNAAISVTGIFNPQTAFFTHIRADSTASNGILTIVGNITSGGGSSGCVNISATNYTLNGVGNFTAGGDNAIAITQAATVNITGNLTGAAAAGIAWNGGSGGVVNITGNVTGAASAGIFNNSTSQTITINGNVTAGSAANGIVGNTIGTLVTVNGNLTNTSDYMAVLALKMRISPTTQQTWTYQTAGPNRQMFTANAFSGGTVPAASDVRLGVSYASGSLSGTCAIPPANSVAFGVPVDNTTGNAVITRAQLYSDTGAIIAAYPQIN
jgi:hypothetical protein